MVTTLANSGIYGNEETNKILNQIAGYKTHMQVVKEYFGLRDDELKNSKRLKELGVQWLPRLGELGVTEEKFDEMFGDVIEKEIKKPKTKSKKVGMNDN